MQHMRTCARVHRSYRDYRELRFKEIQESLVLNPRGMNLFALFLHKCIYMYNMCVLDLLQAMRKRVFMQVSQRQNVKMTSLEIAESEVTNT
jgi:hypothetical protein